MNLMESQTKSFETHWPGRSVRRFASAAITLVATVCPTLAPADQPPSARLENEAVTLQMYLPDPHHGFYRGVRFDHSGMVFSARWANHTFFAQWHNPPEPSAHDNVAGTAEEFGMEQPLGYAGAKPGGTFVKIGVGVLRRPDDQAYQFYRAYEVEQWLEWKVEQSKNLIRFQQELRERDGWGYRYAKEIELLKDQPGFVIRRTLKNTGSRTIRTDHYGHNFVNIDNIAVGRSYHLTFPFEPHSVGTAPPSVRIDGKSVSFAVDSLGQNVWMQLRGGKTAQDHGVTISAAASDKGATAQGHGATLRISGDLPPTKWVIYGAAHAVCPEPFVEISLAPGESRTFATQYHFGESHAPAAAK